MQQQHFGSTHCFQSCSNSRTADTTKNDVPNTEQQLPPAPCLNLGIKRRLEDGEQQPTAKKSRACKGLSETATLKRVLTVASNYHRNGNAKNKRRHWGRMTKAVKNAVLAGVSPRELIYAYCRHSKWTPPPPVGVLIIDHSVDPNTFLPNDCLPDWQTTSIFHLLCMQCGEICLAVDAARSPANSQSSLEQLKAYVETFSPVVNLRDGHLRTALHYVLSLCQSKFGGGGRTRGQIWQLCTDFAKFLYDFGFDDDVRDSKGLRPSDFATGWCKTVFLAHVRANPRVDQRVDTSAGLACPEIPVPGMITDGYGLPMQRGSDCSMIDLATVAELEDQQQYEEPWSNLGGNTMPPMWPSSCQLFNNNNGFVDSYLPPIGSLPALPSDASLVSSLASNPSLTSLASFDSSTSLTQLSGDLAECNMTGGHGQNGETMYVRHRNDWLQVGSLGNPSYQDGMSVPHNFVGVQDAAAVDIEAHSRYTMEADSFLF